MWVGCSPQQAAAAVTPFPTAPPAAPVPILVLSEAL